MRLTEKSDDDKIPPLPPGALPPDAPPPPSVPPGQGSGHADGGLGSVVQRRFLDNDAAAEYLCLSPRTLEKLRVVGQGPSFRKLGRRVVYSLEDLNAWADQHKQRSTSKPKWEGGEEGN